MGSRDSIHLYDGATLGALVQAFRQSWAETKSRNRRRNWVKDHELRNALADKLLELANQGLTDPAELERVALQSFPADTDKLGEGEWARRSDASWSKAAGAVALQQIKA